jgi:hypothetical protein
MESSKEMVFETPRDLQMLFAAMTRLGCISLDVKGGKVPNLRSGYTETSSIHNRTVVHFVLVNHNKK